MRVTRPGNVNRTVCYHFATQLGSTGWHKPARLPPANRISPDNSIQAGIERNRTGRLLPNCWLCQLMAPSWRTDRSRYMAASGIRKRTLRPPDRHRVRRLRRFEAASFALARSACTSRARRRFQDLPKQRPGAATARIGRHCAHPVGSAPAIASP